MAKYKGLIKAAERIGMPSTVLTGEPQLEILGNRQMVIDGCRGVLTYDDCYIKLAAASFCITITGSELSLTTLTPTCATVTGNILSIGFGE